MEKEKRTFGIAEKLEQRIELSDLRRVQETLLGEHRWELLNSSLFGRNGISEDFINTLNIPDCYIGLEKADEIMSLYLKSHFKEKKDGIIFVEMGGPGEKLSRDINEICKVKKSFGMTLDMGIEMAIDQNKLDMNDLPNHHKIITGDMFLESKFSELKKNLNGEKIDLLIERMRGGTTFLGEAVCCPAWYHRQLNNWYQLVNDNGIMLIETPDYALIDFPYIEKWFEKMHSTEGINFVANRNKSFFRIQKLPNAPMKIPSPYSIIKAQLNESL